MKIDEEIDAYFIFQDAAYSTKDVAQIEKVWGRTLPDDFKKFATTYGGVSLNSSLHNDFLATAE